MKNNQFTRVSALVLALVLLCTALPVGAGAEETAMSSFYSSEEFEAQYTYEGNDLGAVWTKESTTFRVWAPTADAVTVNLYESGTPGTEDLLEQVPMTADVNGTWLQRKQAI